MKRSLQRVVYGHALVVLGALATGLFVGSCSSGSSSPHPQGAAAAETAATMSRTSMVGFGTLTGFELPGTPAPATLGAPTSDAPLTTEGFLGRAGILGILRRSTEEATTDFPCSTSGFLRLICNPITGGSVAEVLSFGCTEDLGGFDLEVRGSFEATSDDPNCEDGLDAATDMDVMFGDYTLITRVDGVELGRVTMDGLFSASGETEPACVDSNGSVGGSFFVQAIGGGVASSLTAQNLTIDVQNVAATCLTTMTINGTLIVVDGQAKQSLSQTYSNFVVTTTPDGGTGSFVTVDGIASVPCIGDVLFATVTPIHIAIEGDCPVDGTVDVTVVSTDETSRIQHNPDGSVDIDFMVDGSVDITRTTCDDLSSPCS